MKLLALASTQVVSVGPNDSVDRAICAMEEHGIHHLPVIDDNRVVGMLSDRDLLMAVGWKLQVQRATDGDPAAVIGPVRVHEIMSHPALTLGPDTDLHTAARIMISGRFHAIPVVQHDVIIGIVTSQDVFRYFGSEAVGGSSETFRRPVREFMTANIVAVAPRESLNTASQIMHDRYIRHLPVTSNGALLGILTDRDVRRACGEDQISDGLAEANGTFYLGATAVIDIMTRNVKTAGPDATLLTALRDIARHRIGCLPIVEDHWLIGLLTDTDMLRIIADIDDADHESATTTTEN